MLRSVLLPGALHVVHHFPDARQNRIEDEVARSDDGAAAVHVFARRALICRTWPHAAADEQGHEKFVRFIPIGKSREQRFKINIISKGRIGRFVDSLTSIAVVVIIVVVVA